MRLVCQSIEFIFHPLGVRIRDLVEISLGIWQDGQPLVQRFQNNRPYLGFVLSPRSIPLRLPTPPGLRPPPPPLPGAGAVRGDTREKPFPGCKPPENVKRDRYSPPLSVLVIENRCTRSFKPPFPDNLLEGATSTSSYVYESPPRSFLWFLRLMVLGHMPLSRRRFNARHNSSGGGFSCRPGGTLSLAEAGSW